MKAEDCLTILFFMIVATVSTKFLIKPETVNELLIGEWFMVLGVIIGSVLLYLTKELIKLLK